MGRPKTRERVDEFLPYLQKSIHALQDERTGLLRAIEIEKSRVEEIDKELEIAIAERDSRVRVEAPAVPDFPPEEERLTEEPAGDPQTETYDNSGFARPGQAIFMPVSGINEPLKSTAFKNASLLVIRAWVGNNRKEWFKTGEVIQDTGFSRGIVQKRLTEMVEMGWLKQRGNRASSMYHWKRPPAGPRNHPTHDTPTNRSGGAPIAHTRPRGPSGKQGENRKRSARGVKVKRARQGT